MIVPVLASLATANEFTIGLAGDVMLNGIAPSAVIWDDIRGTLSRPDVTFANLEIPLTDSRIATERKSKQEVKARTQFILKANPAHAPFLAQTGIDMVSLANNHGMDYGDSGNRQMRMLLTKFGIHYAGAGENATDAMQIGVIRLKDGTRVGLFSAMAFVGRKALLKTTPATTKSAGINVLNFDARIDNSARARIKRIVDAGHKQCDFLVIGLHWGVERQTLPTDYQVELGREFATAGADLVWGHHPHVLQGAESYRGVPIFYSLGNLISSMPAETALFHLRMRNHHLTRAYMQPISIKSGKATRVSGVQATARRKSFAELCKKLRIKHPSKLSRPIFDK